jgi:hypothetical protein
MEQSWSYFVFLAVVILCLISYESCYAYDISRTILVRRDRSTVGRSRTHSWRSPTRLLPRSIARRTHVVRGVSCAQQFRFLITGWWWVVDKSEQMKQQSTCNCKQCVFIQASCPFPTYISTLWTPGYCEIQEAICELLGLFSRSWFAISCKNERKRWR